MRKPEDYAADLYDDIDGRAGMGLGAIDMAARKEMCRVWTEMFRACQAEAVEACAKLASDIGAEQFTERGPKWAASHIAERICRGVPRAPKKTPRRS